MGNHNEDKNSPAWISTRKDLDFLDDDISAQIERRHPTQRRKHLYPLQSTTIMAAPNNVPMPTLPLIHFDTIGAGASSARKHGTSPTDSVGSRFSQRLMERERVKMINAKNDASPALSDITETNQRYTPPTNCNGTLPTPRRLSTVHDNVESPASSENSSGSSSDSSKSSDVLLSGYTTRKSSSGSGSGSGSGARIRHSSKKQGHDRSRTPATAGRSKGHSGIGDIDDGDDESVSHNDYKVDLYPFIDRVLHWIHPQLFITEKNRKCVERACLIEAYKVVEDGLTSDDAKLHAKMKKEYLLVVNSIDDEKFLSKSVSSIILNICSTFSRRALNCVLHCYYYEYYVGEEWYADKTEGWSGGRR